MITFAMIVIVINISVVSMYTRGAPLALPSVYNPPASRRRPPQQLNKQSLRKCNDLFVYVYFLHTQTSIHTDVLLCIFVCRLDTQVNVSICENMYVYVPIFDIYTHKHNVSILLTRNRAYIIYIKHNVRHIPGTFLSGCLHNIFTYTHTKSAVNFWRTSLALIGQLRLREKHEIFFLQSLSLRMRTVSRGLGHRNGFSDDDV
uniref:Secreted protein n=1 Tax=Glossina morsitans morsitans TaxID=37546 RepID=A0A1B0G3L7_GLOMM